MTSSQAPTDGQTQTDAVNRTAQEILAALEARDSAKLASYYAPDAVLATPGRPAVRGGEGVSKAIRNDMADPNFKLSVSDGKTDVAASGDWPTAESRSKSPIRTRRPNRWRTPRPPP